jgi:hypothetical protein
LFYWYSYPFLYFSLIFYSSPVSHEYSFSLVYHLLPCSPTDIILSFYSFLVSYR